MKKVLIISAMALLVLVVLGGLGAAYIILGSQDRGMTADGRMAPPASVRNAPRPPSSMDPRLHPPSRRKSRPKCQLPTEFKLPTELDIATPQVPDGISAPASGQKS